MPRPYLREVSADRGYDVGTHRRLLRERGIA
jgi:hypothetical protein